MTDHDTFLQAILAQPDDDLPRLIYADWLEEQGDAPRAEFIRVQCELAGMSRNDPRRREMSAREIDLLAENGGRWRRELPEVRGVLWQDFERGFPAILYITRLEEWARSAARLFDLQPIQGALLWEPDNPGLEKFADDPLNLRFRRLNLVHASGAAGLRRLMSSPHLSQLRMLTVNASQLNDRALGDLLPTAALSSLTTLHLPGNYIRNKGVEVLAKSALSHQLTGLVLDNNQISSVGARTLLKAAQFDSLTLLDLRHNDIVEPARSELRERFGERVLL
jgi:uncharacterized protein (TIGR02996 family)